MLSEHVRCIPPSLPRDIMGRSVSVDLLGRNSLFDTQPVALVTSRTLLLNILGAGVRPLRFLSFLTLYSRLARNFFLT